MNGLLLGLFLLVLSLLGLEKGCCTEAKRDPSKPSIAQGWKVSSDGGYSGEFVLAKGEAAEKGDLGIKVIEITRGKECKLREQPIKAKARLLFYRVKDHSPICETDFNIGSANLLRAVCNENFEIDVLSVVEINTEQSWVQFVF